MPKSFQPAWWLPSPHLQTLYGALLRKPPRLARLRERLWLNDGDFLDLDWYECGQSTTPLVLILHGLTGSSQSHYVLGLQQKLAEQNWSSVALNWRGCSGEPNLLPRGYHSGVSDDVQQVIRHIQQVRPNHELHAVGYSLGGNVLLKYLGEQGQNSGLSAAVAVSVPFRLDQCAERISQGFSKVYQAYFMRELCSYVRTKQQNFSDKGFTQHYSALAELGPPTGIKNFWEFDQRYTAPLHGYQDAADYYQRASSRFYLSQIHTPTLLIQASDDPFVFRHSIPTPDELSSCTELELHDKGGHVGFIGGSSRTPEFYLEQRIPQWLSSR